MKLIPFALLLSVLSAPVCGQASNTPIADARRSVSEEVRKFDEHVTTLANPFFEGRVPGSRGMEIAKEYMEYWFKQAGLTPGFHDKDGNPGQSWRQALPLGQTRKIMGQHLAIGDAAFTPETDFLALTYGGAGDVTAPVVFCGYGISRGPDGFNSFGAEEVDLKGKIAVVLRFEPMNDEGTSAWAESGWTWRAGYTGKIRSCARKFGAAAVVVVNPPGCADPRSKEIEGVKSNRKVAEVPIVLASCAVGEAIAKAAGKSMDELVTAARAGSGIMDLQTTLTVKAEVGVDALMAENVGALLPGRGKLKDELVVVGAHLDHLGMGYFGSRSGPGALHPGADDNASGCAAVIMIGERLVAHYKALPANADARSVLFVGWSAEESGLNGSRYYVNNPIVPIENHSLCINFDMIGRITKKRLRVAGAETGKGMGTWLKPLTDESDLVIVSGRSGGGSDHMSFMQKRVPVLFSIIADFHGDYHTPKDLSWKMNCVDAVKTVDLYEKITEKAATMPEKIEWAERGSRRSR